MRLPIAFLFLFPCVPLMGFSETSTGGDPFDLLIRNGKIVDGTGNPWFHGDVAIRGDKIIAMGKLHQKKAKRQIDAKGLVVAPGFIDMHSHSDYLLLEDGNAQSTIRQGATTDALGACASPRPFHGKLAPKQLSVP